MRRGDPLTPQVRQAVCKWIVSAYRRRNDDSERVSFPVPTKAGIAAPLRGSQLRFYLIVSNTIILIRHKKAPVRGLFVRQDLGYSR